MKTRRATIILLILFGLSMNFQCKKDETPEEVIQVVQFSKTVEGLMPNTVYYWKIKSTTLNQNEFNTETITYWFDTGAHGL